ncbi:MAG: hypothetical protein H7Z16_20595 [Pyrinomonadaceae bacterium]|nr:hypothetical protein [Pyrinomonadaceae bacterium]
MTDSSTLKSHLDLVEIALRMEPETLPPEMRELRENLLKLLNAFNARLVAPDTPKPEV